MPDDLPAAWGQADQVLLPARPSLAPATRVLRAAAGPWEPPSWPHRRRGVLFSLFSLPFNCLETELTAAGTLSCCWSHDWRLVCSQAPQTHIFTLGLLLNDATDRALPC